MLSAARPLLAELLARAPVAAGKPAMSGSRWKLACASARELDLHRHRARLRDRGHRPEPAEGMFLQNQINAELPMLGGYDEPGLNDFQHR